MEGKMRNINRIIVMTVVMIIGFGFGNSVKAATSGEALNFFETYITEAKSYSSSLLNMYSPNAKIIRQVIKPNGQLANATFRMSDYRRQMIISSKVAKIRHYKNYYSNIKVIKEGTNTFKIEAYRTPSTGGSRLKTVTVVEKIGNKWLITEEMMQTREQILLKYAK